MNVSDSEIVLLVIVGREKDHRMMPFVIGAFNEEYLNQLPLEDAEEQIDKLKRTWTMEPSEYDWREARVRIHDGALIPMFATPELSGEVLASNRESSP